jgi:hypothetical protein
MFQHDHLLNNSMTERASVMIIIYADEKSVRLTVSHKRGRVFYITKLCATEITNVYKNSIVPIYSFRNYLNSAELSKCI